MTNTDTSELSAQDPRMGVAIAVQTAKAVVAGVSPDQMDDPTPCDAYTVRELMGHLIVAFQRLEMVGRRHQGDWGPLVASGIADDGYGAALDEVAQAIHQAWQDDTLLDEVLVLPFAEMPGAFALGMYVGEYLTHTWDLAAATGQTVEWPDMIVAPSLEGLKMGLPAEARQDPEMPFGTVVEVPADAPLIEQLAAWSGRNPADWPSAVR